MVSTNPDQESESRVLEVSGNNGAAVRIDTIFENMTMSNHERVCAASGYTTGGTSSLRWWDTKMIQIFHHLHQQKESHALWNTFGVAF